DVQCSLGKLLSDRRNKEDNPLEAIERCVKMRASHFPPGHPKLGLAYSLLAHEHCNAGELDACSDAAEQAVRSLRDHPEHGADYVAALQNLGSARSRLEDYEHAEPLLKQAVAAAKALGPEGDRRRALALNDLALHHMRTGEPTRAIATSEQVLAIYEQLLGADHPEIATMLHNIGLQKLDAGQAAEALPMMERAALLDAKSFGSDHWTVGYDKRGVGLVLLALERHDDAQRAIEEGLAIVKNALGAEHLRTRVVEESLARVYASMGRRETALTLATQSYKTFLEKEGENSKRARDAAAFIETLAP
ncbi:MAG: tetratricopeptide repeat protein, partial [Myxococcota bacterium]